MRPDYIVAMTDQVSAVLATNPGISDYRRDHPWLVGALGNERSDIVFVAENPSLSQVERTTDPATGGPPTIESQWWQSKADKLFRRALVEAGLKTGAIDSAGGWNCYITNVIKQPDYAEEWKKKSITLIREVARIWAPVLRYELLTVAPRLIVGMGSKAFSLLQYLQKEDLIPRIPIQKIPHYSYIGFRADAKRRLGPMHPTRVQEYEQDVLRVARQVGL